MATTDSTGLWGTATEHGDWIQVPRAFIRLSRYDDLSRGKLKPHHFMLLLALAGRQRKGNLIQAFWQELAEDLGCKPDTVRKWGYQLRAAGLIAIKPVKGPVKLNGQPGRRNDRSTFELTGITERLVRARRLRDMDGKRTSKAGSPS